jgi:hypothetical protein
MELTLEQTTSALRIALAMWTKHQHDHPSKWDWPGFGRDLSAAGISDLSVKCFQALLSERWLDLPTTAGPLRLLHPVEQDILKPEAYGFLLQSIRSGLLEPEQVDALLEEVAGTEQHPLDLSALQKAMAKRWRHHLRHFRIH